MSFQINTVPAYSILALLCEIGGAFGLVLGSTILTVFEFVDFLLGLIARAISYKISQFKLKGDHDESNSSSNKHVTRETNRPGKRLQAFV